MAVKRDCFGYYRGAYVDQCNRCVYEAECKKQESEMSVLFDERTDGVMGVSFGTGLASTMFEIAVTGEVGCALPHQSATEPMEAEDVARFGRLLLDAAAKQGVKFESVEPVAIRQLRQLLTVTHFEDLICEDTWKRLLHEELVTTCMGNYSCLTKAGVELCWALGLLDEQESEDGKSS